MSPSPAASVALPDGIEAVLFDLDNTLVDCLETWRAAFAEVLEAEHASHPELRSLGPLEHVHDHVFRPLMLERHAEIGGEWDDELVGYGFRRLLTDHALRDDALAARLSEAYLDALSRPFGLFPDATPTLEALGARYRLGLITNGAAKNQRARIEPLGLDAYFEAIAVSGELGVRKPDPAIFDHVLGRLGVSASAAVHVGDDIEADVGGAKAAGMAAVWVSRDGGAHDGEPVPDATISMLGELLPLLGVG